MTINKQKNHPCIHFIIIEQKNIYYKYIKEYIILPVNDSRVEIIDGGIIPGYNREPLPYSKHNKGIFLVTHFGRKLYFARENRVKIFYENNSQLSKQSQI